MRKGTIYTLVLLILVLAFSGCTRVSPGYKGLMVDLVGTNRGKITELGPGRYHVGINKELHQFPTFNQNYVWTQDVQEGSKYDESFTFPVEGMSIGVDVGIEYFLEEGKIKDIFVQYRKGVNELTDITIRNVVRDSLNQNAAGYSLDRLVTEGMGNLMAKVEEETRAVFAPVGINIKSLSLVTAPRYPNSVTAAIEAKNTATQNAIKVENELRMTEASVAMEIAQTEGNAKRQVLQATANAEALLINAKAIADSNALKTRSLSPQVLEAMRLDAWDGRYPVYMLGSDANILLGQ